ncbi:TerC family protein [Heyndrickxia sporothermodurans]
MKSVIQLALLNLLNDIDNILIIASLLRKNLYEQYPRALFIVKIFAIIMLSASRTLYVSIIQTIIDFPGLHLITGLIVLFIGVRLALTAQPNEENRLLGLGKDAPPIPIHRMLLIILLTDFVISLDTVIITAELSNNIFQTLFVLFFSLVVVFVLLPFLTTIINTFFWLQIIAGGILVQISVHAIAKEPFLLEMFSGTQKFIGIINVERIVPMLAFDSMIIIIFIGIIRLIKNK